MLAATGQEGLSLLEREAPDLVLLDVKMPGMDGIEVLERIRAGNETVPVIVVSGTAPSAPPLKPPKKGAFGLHRKPFAVTVCSSAFATRSISGVCVTKPLAEARGGSATSVGWRQHGAQAGDGRCQQRQRRPMPRC